MEEKIYFEPETTKKKKQSKRKDRRFLGAFFFLAFLMIVILVIIWFLRGSRTVSGHYPANVRNEYLNCSSDKITYLKVGEVESKEKELKATMVFLGEEQLSSISIKYTLKFEDKGAATYAEPIVNTRFHENIAQVIDQYSAFNNKVTLLDDTITVTLHASKNDLVDLAKEFFMIRKTNEPVSLADFRDNFEKQGFLCEASTDNAN